MKKINGTVVFYVVCLLLIIAAICTGSVEYKVHAKYSGLRCGVCGYHVHEDYCSHCGAYTLDAAYAHEFSPCTNCGEYTYSELTNYCDHCGAELPDAQIVRYGDIKSPIERFILYRHWKLRKEQVI